MHRPLHMLTASLLLPALGGASFTSISDGPVAEHFAETTGCAWGDFDADGWPDLFVASFVPAENRLYRNNRGLFEIVADAPFAVPMALSALWADYNNDGHLDLYVGSLTSSNRLWRGKGRGAFAKPTDPAGPPNFSQSAKSGGAAWGDFDNDGLLDLFIANGAFRDAQPDLLLRQEPDGTFSDIATPPFSSLAKSIHPACADIDGDGDLDLFVTRREAPNILCLNQGDGRFKRVEKSPLAEIPFASGAAWADFDNDGDFDLCVTTENKAQPRVPFLFRNLGEGQFEPVNNPFGVFAGRSIACAWGDFDNDGWLDLFVSNYAGENALFRNLRGQAFVRTGTVPDGDRGDSGACAWADFNNDGYLDLFVSNGVHAPRRNLLYRNNGGQNRWLKLRLRGTESNRSAIGAHVRVKTVVGGEILWQSRQVAAGHGWASQGPLELAFGLGRADAAETIEIRWPSGRVQTLRALPANRIEEVSEPPRP